MEKSEAILIRGGKSAVVAEGFVEQAKGSDNVGEDEVFRSDNGSVNVALGSEIHNCIRAVGQEQFPNERSVFDASVDEYVCRMILDRDEIAKIARVGELVEIDHAITGCDSLQHKIRTDKPGPACDQNCTSHCQTSTIFNGFG
jgi:hypothetical protein